MLQNEWRNRAIFAAIIVMLISLFVSRAFLSAGIILFLTATIVHKDILSQLKSFLRSPLLMGLSILFFIPCISGLWSNNIDEWANVMRVKLPLLFLPLAFAGRWQLEERRWKFIAYCFLLLVAIGCCWSLWQYFQNIDVINKSYLRAKTLPTALENDHVRFSWLVSIAVVGAALLIIIEKNRRTQSLLGFLLLLLVIYLHVLSVRTGLLAVYFFFVSFILYLAAYRKKYFVTMIFAVLTMAIASWFLFPTLRNRVRYIVYDFSLLKTNSDIAGTSDANRLISIKAGWFVMRGKPLGAGAGDVKDESRKWYATNLPAIAETDKLLPSSEWMIYGDVAGWPGIILFTMAVAIPFFIKRIRHRFFWVMLIAMATGNLMLEPALEVQFGIFIYCFTILWWWKWLKL